MLFDLFLFLATFSFGVFSFIDDSDAELPNDSSGECADVLV